MIRAATLLVVLGACGRLGFDEVSIGDDGAADLFVQYPTQNLVAIPNTTAIDVAPMIANGPAQFDAALPGGLTIDRMTGRIVGTPTATVDHQAIRITATSRTSTFEVTLFASFYPGLVVDTVQDGADDDAGTNETCFSTAATGCSLRAAIQTANNAAVRELVLLGPGNFSLSSALPNLTNDIVIAGAGPTATLITPPAVHPGYRMIALDAAHELRIIGMGIKSFGSVDGGALATTNPAAKLVVEECDFDGNDSAGSGGVLFAKSGANVAFTNCTFENNTSFGGCCGGWGGVIDGEGDNTMIAVRRSTAQRNSTAWGSFAHVTTGTHLVIENSTLYDNVSTISGTLASPGGTYALTNVTIAFNHNTNPTPDDTDLASAGLYLYETPAGYDLTNVLLVHNTLFDGQERNCSHRVEMTTVTSNGGNLLTDDGFNCTVDFTADRTGSDPGLTADAPAMHGGLTPTMLLLPGSAGIDSGVLAGCPEIDQRGVPRPAHGRCDIGAIEIR